MRYRVGDRVKIKSLKWYDFNKNTFGKVWCEFVTPFDVDMKRFCGRIMTIADRSEGRYRMSEDPENWWTDGMIESLAYNEQQIAIRGHKTRGTDVIEALKRVGGIHERNWSGNKVDLVYYIDWKDKTIHCSDAELPNTFIYPLELFEQEFPFKIGDKVQIKGSSEVKSIRDIQYTEWGFRYGAQSPSGTVEYPHLSRLVPYEEVETVTEFSCPDGYEFQDENGNIINSAKIILKKKEIKTVMKIDNEKQELLLGLVSVKDKGQELIPHKDYEINQDGDKFYLVKKKKEYPKTYGGCCDTLYRNSRHDECYEACLQGYPMQTFARLLICRDAYWKIAGEKMGLGKPWSPTDSGVCYGISSWAGEILHDTTAKWCILTFPTEEMRDAFYENFKELIEQCKELL